MWVGETVQETSVWD